MKIVTINPDAWQASRGYRKNRLLSAEELNQPGTLLQIVTLPPGNHIPPHAHRTSIEVYIVTHGECDLSVNEETILIKPGDILLMEPGDVHALNNRGDGPCEILVFKTNAGDSDTVWTPAGDGTTPQQ
jgi:quercetin dioxygenase-like cupin family protein